MASFVKRYTFVPGEAFSAEVNQNFDDIATFLNNDVVQVDGSVAMTGPLALPAGVDPASDNQAARKAYVDNACHSLYVVRSSADFSIPNAVWTQLPTGTVINSKSPAGVFSLDGSYGVVVGKTGFYQVSGKVTFDAAANTGAVVEAGVLVSGVLITDTRSSISCPGAAEQLSVPLPTSFLNLTAGQILHLSAWQNEGVAVNATIESFINVLWLGA